MGPSINDSNSNSNEETSETNDSTVNDDGLVSDINRDAESFWRRGKETIIVGAFTGLFTSSVSALLVLLGLTPQGAALYIGSLIAFALIIATYYLIKAIYNFVQTSRVRVKEDRDDRAADQDRNNKLDAEKAYSYLQENYTGYNLAYPSKDLKNTSIKQDGEEIYIIPLSLALDLTSKDYLFDMKNNTAEQILLIDKLIYINHELLPINTTASKKMTISEFFEEIFADSPTLGDKTFRDIDFKQCIQFTLSILSSTTKECRKEFYNNNGKKNASLETLVNRRERLNNDDYNDLENVIQRIYFSTMTIDDIKDKPEYGNLTDNALTLLKIRIGSQNLPFVVKQNTMDFHAWVTHPPTHTDYFMPVQVIARFAKKLNDDNIPNHDRKDLIDALFIVFKDINNNTKGLDNDEITVTLGAILERCKDMSQQDYYRFKQYINLDLFKNIDKVGICGAVINNPDSDDQTQITFQKRVGMGINPYEYKDMADCARHIREYFMHLKKCNEPQDRDLPGNRLNIKSQAWK